MPEIEGGHEVYGHHDDLDSWDQAPYRQALYTDDGRLTGIVSASDNWYNIIQYGEILETVGDAVEQRQDDMDIDVHGSISISPTAHKMSAQINFQGDTTVYAAEDDPIDLGLRVRSGHSGFHALKYDVGGMRQVCSNGMMAFVADTSFEQTHSDSFQPGLAYHAVDSVIDGAEVVEQRLEEAQNRELVNKDEALLTLLDLGIDRFLENPLPDLALALDEEINDPDHVTLYDTYNAATRALTHYVGDDVPDYDLDYGFDAAASLLETGHGIPDPRELGESVVQKRADTLVEGDEDDAYWDGEEEAVRELLAAHDLAA